MISENKINLFYRTLYSSCNLFQNAWCNWELQKQHIPMDNSVDVVYVSFMVIQYVVLWFYHTLPTRRVVACEMTGNLSPNNCLPSAQDTFWESQIKDGLFTRAEKDVSCFSLFGIIQRNSFLTRHVKRADAWINGEPFKSKKNKQTKQNISTATRQNVKHGLYSPRPRVHIDTFGCHKHPVVVRNDYILQYVYSWWRPSVKVMIVGWCETPYCNSFCSLCMMNDKVTSFCIPKVMVGGQN